MIAAVASKTLADLRLATLVGEAHLQCLSAVCPAVDVREQDWSSGPAEGPPDLLLIEASGLRKRRYGGGPISDEKVERALELVAWGESDGVPTVLWETDLSKRIDTPVTLMGKVDHLFVADPDAAASVTERLDGRRPMQLPLAAQVVPRRPPPADQRQLGVGFLGRWPAEFSGRLRRELEQILDAALAHGLVVFQRERDAEKDALPDRFASSLVPVRSAGDAIKAYQDCRVVIGFDPRNNGRLMVPQVGFDALASGAAVIVPNHPGLRRMFRYSTSVVKDREEAEEGLGRILGDEREWTEASGLARMAILHAHTYSHRLATIASAARFRLVPARAMDAAASAS
jgi:glycosyl transferase family 1